MIDLKITKPTLLIDQEKCEANIRRMIEKAEQAHAKLRPHFKTHQSAIVGQWFRKYGISAITVSSVSMASYFAHHGWRDICIAFPVNMREIDQITRLASFTSLSLLVESPYVVEQLGGMLQNVIEVYIKIDVGACRTGIPLDDTYSVLSVADHIKAQPKLKLAGLLAHAGQTYSVNAINEIQDIAEVAYSGMIKLKTLLNADDLVLSWGDTPSCSMLNPLPPFDEWRPGNFVFYDVMQSLIGSCITEEIAVAMACPVVALHTNRNQAVIYGGAVHFSKEFIVDNEGKRLFGYVVDLNENGWSKPVKGAFVTGLSQEHGLVNLPDHFLDKVKPGCILAFLPIHSCLTVSAMKEMISLKGEIIPCMK
jgi:D-serine deaminase-like pyridoxal phosphate-dependent protein